MALKQLPWDPATEFFEGRATFHQPPTFFVLYRDIIFTDGIDGLDYYRAALLEMDDSTRVVLKQHRGNNSSWTNLYLHPAIEDPVQVDRIVSSIMRDLNLPARDLVWQYKAPE